MIGGSLVAQFGQHRGKHLSTAATIQAVFLAASVVLAAVSRTPVAAGFHYALIIVLGMCMGIQNATARKLGVPDMTTTVLTLTITGIGADSTFVGGKDPWRGAASSRSPRCWPALLSAGLWWCA
jgi:uncharacterized membrane protein YoaK (UPF0700 family)